MSKRSPGRRRETARAATEVRPVGNADYMTLTLRYYSSYLKLNNLPVKHGQSQT